MILISLISKTTGYFRDATITSQFGATLITDAYVIALLIPEVLFNIFGNSLTANFVPIYYEAERTNRHKRFLSTLFSLYLLLAAVIFILGYKNTNVLINIFSSGFSGLAFQTTAFLLKIFLFNIFFITITYFCLAYLQVNNRFLISSSIGVFYNLAVIGSMYLKGNASPLSVLIFGTILGYIAQFVIQLPKAITLGLPAPTWRISISPEIKNYIVLSLPVAALAILGQVNIAMDNYFASRLGEGNITTLNIGYRVLMGIYSLLITNTMIIIYPILSRSMIQRDGEDTLVIIQKITNWLIILLVPLAAYLFFNAGILIELMFRRGSFTAAQCDLTASVFRGYIVGLFFYAFRDLMVRYFFAEHSNLTILLNGVTNSVLNFIYLILFVPLIGLPGVSLATALSAISSSIILLIVVRIKVPVFRKLKVVKLVCTILLASVLSVMLVKLLMPNLGFLAEGSKTINIILIEGLEFLLFGLLYCLCFVIVFKKKIFGFLTK
ncbi:MAG: murein biosynthesis integral membrane protein MurJ [Carboxydocellales bacterium]